MSFPTYPDGRPSGVEWLGDIPAHWSVERLKRSVSLVRNGVWGDEPQGNEDDLPCVRVADFDRQRFRVVLDSPTLRRVTEKEREGRLLEKGDLLLEKSGGGDVNPVGCVVRYEDTRPAVCSNFVARVVVAEGMDSSFWRYVHAAAYSIRLTTTAINQTSGIQNLDQQRYFDERAAFPPLPEQRAIAAFLDRETAKIDVLVAEQRRLVDLLKEKRQAVISQAVTKGLNPRAQMKPSGIEWLGDMPAHWDMFPLKRDLAFLTSGSRGWAENYSDEGELFIRIANLTRDGIGLDLSGVQRVVVPDDAEGPRTRVRSGDVLFSITAYLGSVAVVPDALESAYVSQHVALARLRRLRLTPHWVGYVALSVVGKTWFETRSYGGTKIQLSLDDIGDLPMPVPPVAEQNQISAYVERELAGFARLTADTQRAIDLLQERRTALISAVVTGKIDVRGLSEPEAA